MNDRRLQDLVYVHNGRVSEAEVAVKRLLDLLSNMELVVYVDGTVRNLSNSRQNIPRQLVEATDAGGESAGGLWMRFLMNISKTPRRVDMEYTIGDISMGNFNHEVEVELEHEGQRHKFVVVFKYRNRSNAGYWLVEEHRLIYYRRWETVYAKISPVRTSFVDRAFLESRTHDALGELAVSGWGVSPEGMAVRAHFSLVKERQDADAKAE